MSSKLAMSNRTAALLGGGLSILLLLAAAAVWNSRNEAQAMRRQATAADAKATGLCLETARTLEGVRAELARQDPRTPKGVRMFQHTVSLMKSNVEFCVQTLGAHRKAATVASEFDIAFVVGDQPAKLDASVGRWLALLPKPHGETTRVSK